MVDTRNGLSALDVTASRPDEQTQVFWIHLEIADRSKGKVHAMHSRLQHLLLGHFLSNPLDFQE